ncbi:hypothetical protein HOP50_16g79010 [Chloropicon primus]|nr:hypothetical protein HOP50_16g79010 [Chloropicon primus]
MTLEEVNPLLGDLPSRGNFASIASRRTTTTTTTTTANDDDDEEDDKEKETSLGSCPEEDLEACGGVGGVVHGRFRRYVCDHNTKPPGDQTIKSESQPILIRSLLLRKGKGQQKKRKAGGSPASGTKKRQGTSRKTPKKK